jgi:hypothetical protein
MNKKEGAILSPSLNPSHQGREDISGEKNEWIISAFF